MFFIQQIFLKNNPWYKLHINEKSSVKNFCLNMKKENLKNNYKKIEPVHISKILMPLFIYSQDHSLKLNEQKLNNPLLATIIVDGNELGIKREDILDEKFLFSPKTTERTEIELEIDQIEDDEYKYSAWKNTQIGLTVGGSAFGMWFAYKGLTAWEKWMKEQEQKDIEEEIKMTGTYIDPGAGNVETSIDPVTGKKINIKDKDKKNDIENN
jgi:hypothetical protein